MPRQLSFAVIIFMSLWLACFSLPILAQTQLATHHKNIGDDGLVIREKTQVVTLNVTVTDSRNRPVVGLTRNNFDVYEDKVKQNIEYFVETDVPVSVGIIFDVSASMESKLTKARAALQAFVQTSHPDDDFFLVAFNQQAQLVADYTDGETVVNKMTYLKTSGGTALYDAVYLGLDKLKNARHKKQVLIVISDGEDNSSRYSLRELGKFIKESDALIYSLSVSATAGSNCGQLCQIYAKRALDEMSGFTGGRAFFPVGLAELEQATTQIALELRRQYSLGYVSTRTDRDSKWRKIATKIKSEKGAPEVSARLVVRTKDGYYAIP